MSDDEIKAALQEVGAAWLMDKADEYCQANEIRHVVAAAVAAERERCAALCDEAKAAIWDLHEPAVKQAAQTVCENLAARIRGVEQ